MFSIKSHSTSSDGSKSSEVKSEKKKLKKEKEKGEKEPKKKEIKKELEEEQKSEKKRNESESSILNEFNFIRRSERIFIHDSIICSIPLLQATTTGSTPSTAAAEGDKPKAVQSIKKRRRSSETGQKSVVSIRRPSTASSNPHPVRKVSFDDTNREPLRYEQLELTDADLDVIHGSNHVVRIVLKNPEDGNLYTASVRNTGSSLTKFEVTLDGSRTRTLLLDREHLKKNSVKELIPHSLADFLTFSYDRPPETSPKKKKRAKEERNEETVVRVCAFWSGQVRILYTGTVGITREQIAKEQGSKEHSQSDRAEEPEMKKRMSQWRSSILAEKF